MLKAGGADFKGQRPIPDFPLFFVQRAVLPAAAARVGANIPGIRLFPVRMRFWRVPDDLRVRPDQQHITPTLQLFSAGRVNDFIVLPLVGQNAARGTQCSFDQSHKKILLFVFFNHL